MTFVPAKRPKLINTDAPPPSDRNGWFKSSHSSTNGTCVEIKFDTGAVLVRDSKDRRDDRPILCISSKEWHSFLAAI
ncbi:MAG TPA: DUF397 domain-containing protein [Pseudonocardiaceae bacterium]|nr:DUF397 domain-containing protein [Pseudonocardiaceae bacterium]